MTSKKLRVVHTASIFVQENYRFLVNETSERLKQAEAVGFSAKQF